MRRHELTDEEWATLEPLLPPSRPATGRPNKNHRTILNGILWILRTGAPWRDLPERYGSWRTVYSRFRRWQQAGVWDRVLRALQSTAAIRNWLAQREIEAVIPKRENEMGPKQYDREAYRERTIVERTINRLKRYRRIATRYEKLAASYLALVTIACI